MPSLSIPSPVGRLTIEEADDNIVAIRWGDDPGGNGSPLLAEAARQLAAYFDGERRDFDLPLAPAGTAFEGRVWAAMQDIPYGETAPMVTSAHITDSAPRAVGRACGQNPIPIVIPCHRVLAEAGLAATAARAALPPSSACWRSKVPRADYSWAAAASLAGRHRSKSRRSPSSSPPL